MIKEGIQRVFESLGDGGCYFICIYKLAEMITGKDYNLADCFEYCYDNGWVGKDGFVFEPAKILRRAIDQECDIAKRDLNYILAPNEYEITMYKHGKYGHFVVTQDGKVIFDPLGDSVTVAKGKPSSKRVFTLR